MSKNTKRSARRGLTAGAAVLLLVASLLAVPTPASAALSDRFGGVNRYDTARVMSDTLDTCSVAVANGQNFPDGLAGAVLGISILLTEADALPTETVEELDRLEAECPGGVSEILVLGGEAAVSADVFDELATEYAPGTTSRLAGANRYETALAIAEHFDDGPGITAGTVFLATGGDFPDALSAGPASGLNGFPILLNDGDELRQDVVDFLVDRGITRTLILGGPAAVPETVEQQLDTELGMTIHRYAGADRAETAVVVAEAFFASPLCALLVNANAFPDALAAGPYGAKRDCPIVLVDTSSIPTATEDWLVAEAGSILAVVAIGGTGVISEATLAEAAALA